MYIEFADKDLAKFKEILSNKDIKLYLEYGSGGSTYYAANLANIVKVYSVESDPSWIKNILNETETQKITFILTDYPLDCGRKHGIYGYPHPDSDQKKWIEYSDISNKLDTKVIENVDVVLIDGRFRVACLLKLYQYLKPTALVLFDDFTVRSYYHIVLDYFEISWTGERMVILKKIESKDINPELISIYELDPR